MGRRPAPPGKSQEMLGRFTATEEQTGSGREDQGRCSAMMVRGPEASGGGQDNGLGLSTRTLMGLASARNRNQFRNHREHLTLPRLC